MISDPRQMERFHDGEVLMTDKTDRDLEPIMKMTAKALEIEQRTAVRQMGLSTVR